ncbi:hypothetical protein EVAR_79904_1 [Eumeta japonica]|uniref:Uncharacterized protein n=1 Tax=Eumeta variegata TaxID=151549 RepID=A0A4C1TZS6_EUMVA|nr:hypothetical protein EVAR_79904_1 [Eumeta japonica]
MDYNYDYDPVGQGGDQQAHRVHVVTPGSRVRLYCIAGIVLKALRHKCLWKFNDRRGRALPLARETQRHARAGQRQTDCTS